MDKNGKLMVLHGENKDKAVDLYTPLKKLPAPNAKLGLSKDQKFWYQYFGDQLIATKKLMKPDLIHLHRLACSVDYYSQAEAKIRKFGYEGGLIQTFKNGTTNISGHVTIREKMLKEIDELSKHFGFSFMDRKKIKEDKPAADSGQGNLFEAFSKMKSM
jgi:phage terminase small subunit